MGAGTKEEGEKQGKKGSLLVLLGKLNRSAEGTLAGSADLGQGHFPAGRREPPGEPQRGPGYASFPRVWGQTDPAAGVCRHTEPLSGCTTSRWGCAEALFLCPLSSGSSPCGPRGRCGQHGVRTRVGARPLCIGSPPVPGAVPECPSPPQRAPASLSQNGAAPRRSTTHTRAHAQAAREPPRGSPRRAGRGSPVPPPP